MTEMLLVLLKFKRLAEDREMVVCKVCGGNFDNGELVGGVCRECIEEERQQRIRSESVVKMMNSQAHQLELKLEGVMDG